MDRIKQMNLKKALFTITFINITIALFLSILSVWGCVTLRSQIAPSDVVVEIRSDSAVMNQLPERTTQAAAIAEIISVIQMILPILIYIGALFINASMFYRLKLKEPLALLAKGASRIIENDLDFTVEAKSQDELGQLCIAFETMRKTLLNNNRELWRQTEERKRLNAAFSHDLRNPVTVLKGSAKLAKKSVVDGTGSTEQIVDNLSRIENYTGRIERYIETMSSIQRLEEIPIEQEQVKWDKLISEIENMIAFVGADSNKRINFNSSASAESFSIDKSVLFQVAENLISNAIRFAVQDIDVSCSLNETILKLSVTDDGCGFPAALIKNGIRPFQKGSEDTGHFGMGLYICNLLCQKHSGSISIQNNKIGATVSATLKIQ
ncbi:MAG TPA: sensor histidine kinase [Lachnospiraceae bacterium]|nr:sensor histidine kinase [Lachnospiraceae bacterium]